MVSGRLFRLVQPDMTPRPNSCWGSLTIVS
nr:MAG TPA: hypothetical protein [Caudoviricetes sp.]